MRRTAVLLTALTLAACGSEPATEPARRYSGPTHLVAEAPAPDWRTVGATVSTVDEAIALARIPGVLVSLSVKEGDRVAKNQVIGRIVDSQIGFQSSAVDAQAAAMAAAAAEANAELKRTRFLYDQGVYAKARLDQAQAAASAADAQTRAARAQRAAIDAVAGNGVVVAPSAGRVLHADIPAGSPVAPGMAVATITSGPVVLRLDIPESLGAALRPGTPIRAAIAPGGGTVPGAIQTVYPAVSAGRVTADARVPGLDDRLIGRRVSVQVQAGTRAALLVPAAAITTRFGIDYVTVVGRDGATATVPVQTASAGIG
ncbi:MAG: efflux RND transporter periplasmic adaptor subunit, partial [Alphaproteobacteria bacterium]|nr:efflux RND transporter periplasmic adaptor subunit [Alphaproteobacteria bacterium]